MDRVTRRRETEAVRFRASVDTPAQRSGCDTPALDGANVSRTDTNVVARQQCNVAIVRLQRAIAREKNVASTRDDGICQRKVSAGLQTHGPVVARENLRSVSNQNIISCLEL